tara:strand:- start:150 stop:326 length:177 start_codon:yes stop_codon:yes gene_type:complete
MVNWLYENEGYLNQPYTTTLAARLGEQTFKEIIPPSIFSFRVALMCYHLTGKIDTTLS